MKHRATRAAHMPFVAVLGLGLVVPAISHASARPFMTITPCEVVKANVRSSYSVQGTTPAEIKQRFASVIESNFANGAPETIVNRLSDRELSDLATRYNALTTPGNRPLLTTFATRLGSESLIRVAGAFGPSAVGAAVKAHASPAVQAAVLPALAGLAPKGVAIQPLVAPTTDMTIQEIYLEFRTAPVGSLGAASALSETAIFAASRIGIAWWVGNAIGTQINNAIETYDPSLSDAIGGTVAGMVNAVQSAANDVQEGQYEKGIDDLFGLPVWSSGNYQGDYDDTYPMYDFYLSVGGCD